MTQIKKLRSRLSKKYNAMIDEIIIDDDGVWVYLYDGYWSNDHGCRLMSENSITAIIRSFKSVVKLEDGEK